MYRWHGTDQNRQNGNSVILRALSEMPLFGLRSFNGYKQQIFEDSIGDGGITRDS